MKIKTLKQVKKIICPKEQTLPILDCFYITKDYIYLSNLEIYIRVRHHFPIAEGPAMAINARFFLQRLEHMKAPYTISYDDLLKKVTFQHGQQKTIINTQDAIDFPLKYIEEILTEENKPVEYCTISAREVNLMNIAAGYTADDELRPVMQAVCLSKDYIVSSDAHELYYHKIPELYKEDILFSTKVIKLMMLFPGLSYKISKFQSNLCAESEDVTIWWRSDIINYPNWKSVVQPREHGVIIPVKETIVALDSIAFAINKAAHSVKFTIKGDSMVMEGSDLDFDISASESVPIINTDNNEIEFGFKFEFLKDILKTLSGEGYSQVKMAFEDNTKSFVFEDQLLLMPMMIN